MAEVVLTDLGKVFADGTVALEGVDLSVRDGEFLVLVGPSGCGKSTLLRIVAGLEDATDGSVVIDGTAVDRLPPKDRDIAMVFQNYALYPHMTVANNLGFALKLRKVPKAKAREQVHEVARTLALDPLLERKPAALSGGQRQRVAMGRAMVRHPKVFLMDEPLSNLDAKLRVAMRGELTRLHQLHRTTTLYVTHDQVEAMTLGNRIAVLNAGRLQQVGTPDELYLRPCNVFVAGFIGSPAMNLARVRLERDGDTLVLVAGAYRWPVPAQVLVRRPALHDSVGRDLVMGLRPGAFRLVDGSGDGGAGTADITATTVAVESLGNEKNILFLPPFEVPDVTGEAEAASASGVATELTSMWTASVTPDATVTTGAEVVLRLNLVAAYFFDSATGLTVPDVDAGTAGTAAPAPGVVGSTA